MRCGVWFAVGLLTVPVLALLAERVTGCVVAVWWEWRKRA